MHNDFSPRRTTIDRTGLRSRLRATPASSRHSSYQPRPRMTRDYAKISSGRTFVSDFVTKPSPAKTIAPTKPIQAAAAPAKVAISPARHIEIRQRETTRGQSVPVHKPQRTKVLARAYVAKPSVMRKKPRRFGLKGLSQAQLIMTMAVCVFVVGIGVSIMGFMTNMTAHAQATAISHQVDMSSASASAGTHPSGDTPSTTPVSSKAVKSYTVAPDLARYITIPKLGVHARVLQVGVTSDGALGTPANVFDTAWYTGSAKPGQPGATVIDGHVSSWTTNGVFYGLKTLTAGDTIQIEKGDGTTLPYVVKKVVTYDANNVDMQSLLLPAEAGKSGLNLMTCGGKYDRNSKEFTQRVAVYAVLQ